MFTFVYDENQEEDRTLTACQERTDRLKCIAQQREDEG